MKIYVVKTIVHREADVIHDIAGVFSSFHNAFNYVMSEIYTDGVDTNKIIVSENKLTINVPQEAVDEWTYPHDYHIDSYILDEYIDPEDDESDED